MVLRRSGPYLLLLLALLLASACQAEISSALQLPDQDQARPTPTPPPSPAPQRVLSICLGEEPRSLFIYGDQSKSAGIIRQALFDSPVDRVNHQETPVLLEEIPSQENGLVQTVVVQVLPGEMFVDARGNIVYLASGVEYRPTGCGDQDCWETYRQEPFIELDQVEIRYRMAPGLLWSDGSPLTGGDSLFSYQAAAKIYGSAGPAQLRYTAAYEVNEAGELVWRGLPGYQGLLSYADYFFTPLPGHQLENFTRDEFLTAPQTNLQPLGWGAYQVQEWVSGDHLTLIPNPYYPGLAEGTPAFDALVFRFMANAEEALAAVRSGECQIAANQPDLVEFQAELLADRTAGKLEIYAAEGLAWEQISLGIESLGKKTTLLQDSALRQALATCIDRESISRSRLDAGMVGEDFLPPTAEGQDSGPVYPYQPAEAGLVLKDLGWIDQDGDPETPRVAQGVEGIADGTQLAFTLLAADSQAGSLTLDYIQEGLQNCGVGLEIQTMPAAALLAAGPAGPVFGRDFDLAYFAWAAGRYQPCRLFLSSEIPGIYPEYPRGWGGVNASGYSNPAYDRACLALSTNLPDSESARQAAGELQEIFRSELPSLPLFFRRDLIISAPGISGLESGYFDLFWNIEALN